MGQFGLLREHILVTCQLDERADIGHRDDLKQMFKASVDRTLILVAGQITQIELSKKRVRVCWCSCLPSIQSPLIEV